MGRKCLKKDLQRIFICECDNLIGSLSFYYFHSRADPEKDGRNILRHVKNFTEETLCNGYEIAAHCYKSMMIKEFYKVTLTLDSNRIVTYATCSCLGGTGCIPNKKGGKGADCKHSSALYKYINSWNSESQTNRKMEFNKPSGKQELLYDKSKTMQEIFGGRFVKVE